MFPKKTFFPLAGILAATLLLSACSSGDGGGDSGTPGSPGGSSQTATPASVTIEPANASGISPTTPIVVKAANGKLTDVTVTSSKGKTVAGEFSPDKLSWKTTEVLGYAGTYQVKAHAQGADGKTVEQQGQVTTLAPKKQANANLIPAPGAVKSTGVGVGQPIVFSFGAPVKNKAAVEKALTVESSPKQDGSWYWMDDKNVHYRPKEYWQPGTTITVTAKIYGVDFGDGVYGAEDRTETYKVHDSWIAKADGSSEQMQIFHNGSMVKSMPISMGKDATPTHLGPHVISDKQANYTMDSCTYGVCPPDPKAYRSDEKFSERISNDGEFVHENPNSVGQQGNSNVSHGCINLNAANAEWFFNNFGLGDVVEVTNSGGPQLPVWDLYGDWSKSWADWQKGSALQ
ncbi:L,D-transpeptidase [Amycolatopsis echigonensis]|uniref:L,D-transpeptidase n=1 Tax=Amycolatopsis echigonensis TaxID=2576905 RepID=A0A2N3WAH9_9PSEU|nr:MULTISPECIES: Ig-like domain-containing protein [Amycolatopsis]MBB2506433.1 L,D-transpeptidase [Amycolatopsis echigonensis]PKV90882.1 peptidoglycan transpeptidase precursor (ErfK-YbiS-YhnG family) [Amycolatopsis niigatensis]